EIGCRLTHTRRHMPATTQAQQPLDPRCREAHPERIVVGDETFARNDILAKRYGVSERTLNRGDAEGRTVPVFRRREIPAGATLRPLPPFHHPTASAEASEAQEGAMSDLGDLKGVVPESWNCIDCGINTAPGCSTRAEVEQHFKAGHHDGVPQRIDGRSEIYQVRDAVWKKAGIEPFGGCLCIDSGGLAV